MNTLMINSRSQGISFNAAEAVAPFAIIEKLATVVGAVLRVARTAAAGASLRPAHA